MHARFYFKNKTKKTSSLVLRFLMLVLTSISFLHNPHVYEIFVLFFTNLQMILYQKFYLKSSLPIFHFQNEKSQRIQFIIVYMVNLCYKDYYSQILFHLNHRIYELVNYFRTFILATWATWIDQFFLFILATWIYQFFLFIQVGVILNI